MPEYKLCYIATERTEYSIMIKANTPEEAFKLFNDPDYDRSHYEEECFLGLIENESDVQIEGEWIDENNNSSHLKRYNEPIKLIK
jgi:hypothetical protein